MKRVPGTVELYIALFQICLLDDGLRDTGIFQDMLTNVLVHPKDIVGRLGMSDSRVIRLAMPSSAITLTRLDLRHDDRPGPVGERSLSLMKA